MGGRVFARHYVPLADKFYYFTQGAVDIGYGENLILEGGSSSGKSKYVLLDIAIKPGLVFFPSQKIGLELTFGNLGWANSRVIWDSVTKRDDGGFDISLLNTLRFGLIYFPQRN